MHSCRLLGLGTAEAVAGGSRGLPGKASRAGVGALSVEPRTLAWVSRWGAGEGPERHAHSACTCVASCGKGKADPGRKRWGLGVQGARRPGDRAPPGAEPPVLAGRQGCAQAYGLYQKMEAEGPGAEAGGDPSRGGNWEGEELWLQAASPGPSGLCPEEMHLGNQGLRTTRGQHTPRCDHCAFLSLFLHLRLQRLPPTPPAPAGTLTLP